MVLIHGTTIEPVQSTVGGNLVVFAPTGTRLFGFDNETSTFELRELSVDPDGVRVQRVASTTADFRVRRMDLLNNRLYIGQQVWLASTFTLEHAFSNATQQCRPLASGLRVVCTVGTSGEQPYTVYDATTHALRRTFPLPPGPISVRTIVPGAAGTVALSASTSSNLFTPAETIWLQSDPGL